MNNSLSTAHEAWDQRWANEADRANWLTPQEVVRDTFNTHLAAKDGVTIADVGCGIGRHSLFYAEQGATVIACDGSPQGLEFGENAAREAGLSERITWHQSPFDQIPALTIIAI